MRTRWVPSAVLNLGLGLGAAGTVEGQSGAGQEQPPSIVYPGSRSSSKWVPLPGGTQVAVDKGVAWQGVEVYLSLTWDLVAVDQKTRKTLWSRVVGAFWNSVSFDRVTRDDGTKTCVVVLRRVLPREGAADPRCYFGLTSGKPIQVPGQEDRPSGKLLKPRTAWHGDQSEIAERFHLLVTTKKGWQTVRRRPWNADAPQAQGAIDFRKEVVLVVSDGNAWNSKGFLCHEAWEDEHRLLVRLHGACYQTMGGGQKVRPCGVFVLPRRDGMRHVVERTRPRG